MLGFALAHPNLRRLVYTRKSGERRVQKLTKYEKEQVDAIEKWKEEEPGVVSQTFGVIIEPLAWLVNKVVPAKAVRGALDFSGALAQWLTDTGDVVRDGGVSSVGELRSKSLELSDRLADEVHNWAIGMAVVEGAGTGWWGLPGTAADVPAIITLALRTIRKIGVCYGYECSSELDKRFVSCLHLAPTASRRRYLH
jgi:hypothetical protein